MAPTPFFFFFFFFFFLTFIKSHGLTITTRLIHRSSYHSPLYNAAITTAELADISLRSSIARHASMTALNENPGLQNIGVGADLVSAIKNNVFYVNFSIGDPPVQQLAIMDTGSSFLWVKCLPCTPCSPKSGGTIFDPANSKTYSPRRCTNDCPKCTNGWFSKKYCKYVISYMGGQTSEGIEATEQLSFQELGAPTVTVVPNVQFGCCSSVTGTEIQDDHFNGILPLGIGEDNSLVARFGSKFSYCIGNVVDRFYGHNQLSIGDESHLDGDSTPIYIKGGIYYVFISHITLNDTAMDIGSGLMTKLSYKYGVVIDSGAEFSFLYTEVFDIVKAEVSKMAEPLLIGVPARSVYELCYKGSVYREARKFPPIGIQFIQEGEFILDHFGMFKQVDDDVFCLAILRSKSDVSYIGIMAQQGYNVGYDLRDKRLFIHNIDCIE
ncbi:Probable aspartic protease At2g35615 [Linum grandiflorum]